MKKSLVALAALAVVGAASAQSTVTLSGIFKAGVGTTKYSNGGASDGTGTSVLDGSSRFIISGTEDLGGGLKAVFQMDQRFRIDDNGGAAAGLAGTGSLTAAASQIAGGNTFVGLSGGFGTVRLGKLDTHYCLGADQHGSRSTALQASSCALLGFVNVPGGAGQPGSVAPAASAINQPIANASRYSNVINYITPNMSGFTGGLSYSTGASGVAANGSTAGSEGAVGSTGQGRAWNARVDYANGPATAGLSYWNATSENRTAGAAHVDQVAWTLAGGWNFGVATVGLTYDRSTVKTGVLPASIDNERNVWSIPVTVPMGAGTFLLTYSRASDTKVGGATAANTGATLWSVGYDYSLSKRTSVGVSYASLNNKTAAAYQLYTQGALGGHAAAVAGQDQSQLYVGIRHAF